MDWITENPIANMFGPDFLVLYAFVIGITLLVCWLGIQNSQNAAGPVPPIPARPNPYEIGYLRGGANEVLRLVLFTLFQRGYLEIVETGSAQKIGLAAQMPPASELSALEAAIVNAFGKPRDPATLFQSALLDRVAEWCVGFESHLREMGLMESEAAKEARLRIAWRGAAVIIVLGIYKLWAATLHGHYNVGFLCIEGVLGLLSLAAIASAPRLSARGEAYIQQLQIAFSQIRRPAQTAQSVLEPTETYLLSMGVFGVGTLSGTDYAAFETMFHRSAAASGAASSGGCSTGSSCSSISSGGSAASCGTVSSCGSATSCGSASSCSSGSSCGGGSGGGGCGGCGGGGSS